MHFYLLDGFWFGLVLFGCMVKFQNLAQLPLDHFTQSVVSSLILPLRLLAKLSCVINRFVSNIRQPALAILIRISYFHQNIIGPYGVVLSLYSLRVFYTSVSWWSLTGVWETASLFMSPGSFSIFWPTSTMLLFGLSPLVLRTTLLALNMPLGIVPSASITIVITVTFMFHSFFSSLARYKYLPLFSSLISTLWSAGTVQSTIQQVLVFFFFFSLSRSGLLTGIKWSVCISKSQRMFCISFSRADSSSCIYHQAVGSNFLFLHNSLWFTFPTKSYLVLYSLCASLLHSLIMWLIVSFILSHNLHLLFSYVLLIFSLI